MPALFAPSVSSRTTIKPVSHSLSLVTSYLPAYLALHQQWKYKLLPMAGISSIAFQGPSPTLCAAGNNVWFDHRDYETATGCMTREAVRKLRAIDYTNFDWKYHDSADHRMCLRHNSAGRQSPLSKY